MPTNRQLDHTCFFQLIWITVFKFLSSLSSDVTVTHRYFSSTPVRRLVLSVTSHSQLRNRHWHATLASSLGDAWRSMLLCRTTDHSDWWCRWRCAVVHLRKHQLGTVAARSRQLATIIYLTLPVTSCTAERSFSSLRLLKTFLRSTVTQKKTQSYCSTAHPPWTACWSGGNLQQFYSQEPNQTVSVCYASEISPYFAF